MGIRAKLVFCLLAVLIPLCAVGSFAFHLFEKQLKERTESALFNTQRLEALRISEILAGYAQDARNLAMDPHVKEFATAIDAYIEAIEHTPTEALNNPPAIGGHDGLALIDLNAEWPLQQLTLELQNKAGILGSAATDLKIISRAGVTLGETTNFSWQPTDTRLVEQAMSSVKTLFGNAFLSDLDQQRVGLVSPIISGRGEVIGALMLETPLKPMTDTLLMHQRTGSTTEGFIAQPTSTGDAQLITGLRFDRKSAFSKIIPAAKELPTNQALDSSSSRLITAPDYRGVQSIAVMQTIPATGWGLVIKIDQQEAYAPLNELRKVLGTAVAITLLVILAGYIVCLGPIAHRLKRTALAAHKITNGDLSVRVCDYKNDEIGHMARTIDSLALQLEQDHRQRMEIENQLRHQATHDELTGLLNRKHANKLIEQLSEDFFQNHTVLFLDLNGFKAVNDFYGHAAGDEVLICVAERLIQVVPNNATLARWGGDEFVIILPQTDQISAEIFTCSIHGAFDTPISTTEGSHAISTSIGLATSNPGKSIQEALVEADSLMYEQKKNLKSSLSIQSMAARTLERALLEDRIELWYEPIVKYDTDGRETLYAAEVKIRIRTSEGGIVLPEELLNDISDTSLTAALYKNALAACTKSIRRWIDTNIVPADFKVHFEVNPDVLSHQPFLDMTLQCMHAEGKSVAPHLTLNVNSLAQVDRKTIMQLKSTGLNVATTHSGVLTSTIKQEKGYQPDATKAGIEFFSDDILAPRLIADFIKHDVELCISGVTTKQELSRLAPYGATLFQGKLFDGPLRAVDFVSRWGQPSASGLIPLTNSSFKLRLAG